MWLEQIFWIWAPVTGAALAWMASRLIRLGREVRMLHMRIAQLEQDSSGNSSETAARIRSAA
jgi:hypothetical protein